MMTNQASLNIRCFRLLVCGVFLSGGASVATAGEIHDLLNRGNIEKAKALLEKNSKLIDTVDKDAMTPLHIAVCAGRQTW